MTAGTWTRLTTSEALQRSSHVASVVDDDIFVFGGELIARQPRDNKIFRIESANKEMSASVREEQDEASPTPRVGASIANLCGKLYVFSGRGGEAMAPVEEDGHLHVFEPKTSHWSTISPTDHSAPYPPARSYHDMTSDGISKVFVHAGCPEKGRLADLWQFDVEKKEWTQLPDAPGPQRGGTSITCVNGKLYRMNGFDGKTEIGGILDVFELESGKWSSRTSDGKQSWPEARSVSALTPVKLEGKDKLVTLFGERDPSSLGHAGAGKMLADWWLYDIESGVWEQGRNTSDAAPAARGWFAADTLGDRQVVVTGGLSEDNERLGDVWTLSF